MTQTVLISVLASLALVVVGFGGFGGFLGFISSKFSGFNPNDPMNRQVTLRSEDGAALKWETNKELKARLASAQ